MLAQLPAAFKKGGSVTLGNSSQRSDGGAATVVVSGDRVDKLGVDPLGALRGFAVAGVGPEPMGIGPAEAIPQVLEQTGLSLDDIGLVELSEAFASQPLAVIHEVRYGLCTMCVGGGMGAAGVIENLRAWWVVSSAPNSRPSFGERFNRRIFESAVWAVVCRGVGVRARR